MFVKVGFDESKGTDQVNFALHDAQDGQLSLGMLEVTREQSPEFEAEQIAALQETIKSHMDDLPEVYEPTKHKAIWQPGTENMPPFIDNDLSRALSRLTLDGEFDYVRDSVMDHADKHGNSQVYKAGLGAILLFGAQVTVAERIAKEGQMAITNRRSALLANLMNELGQGVVYARNHHPKTKWSGEPVIEGSRHTATVIVSTRDLDNAPTGVKLLSSVRPQELAVVS